MQTLLGWLALALCLALSLPGVNIARAGSAADAGPVLECSVPDAAPAVVARPKPAPRPQRVGPGPRTITLVAAPNAKNVRPLSSSGMNYRDLRPRELPKDVQPTSPASPN